MITQSKFAVRISDPCFSEMVQRLAFSFGYTWGGGSKSILHTQMTYLTFIEDEKIFRAGRIPEDDITDIENILSTADQILNRFKNPPVFKKEIPGFILYKNGNVTSMTTADFTKTDFDKVIEERNKWMGKVEEKSVEKEKTPLTIVSFNYTANHRTTCRKVAVVELTDDFVHGLDTCDGNRFKKFLRSRISGNIEFVGFLKK